MDCGFPSEVLLLKPGGRLEMVDSENPANRSHYGYLLVKPMEKRAVMIKPIGAIFKPHNFKFTETGIGAFGSVHLHLARKEK